MECKRCVHFFETSTVSNVKGNTHEQKWRVVCVVHWLSKWASVINYLNDDLMSNWPICQKLKNTLDLHITAARWSPFLEMFLEETLVRHRHSLSPHCSHHMPFTPTTVNTSCFPFSHYTILTLLLPTHHCLEQQHIHTLSHSFLPTHHCIEQQHIHTLSHSFLPTHYCPEQQHIAVQCVGRPK